MKRFLTLAFIFFCSCISVTAQNLKFVQVTDVHLTNNNADRLKDFVQNINDKYQDLDFVVFTGDNIDKAKVQDLNLFLDIVKQLKFKTYILAGNHDLYDNQGMTGDFYMHQVRKKLGLYHSANLNYVIQKGEYILLAMSGVKEVIPSPNGYYKQNELNWLDKMLTKYSDKKVVILQHFPLPDTKSAGHSLYKKEEYLKVLSKHKNVISIISGHYHENREEFCDNIYHIITKNFSNNSYYKLIEIEDGFVYTSLIENNKAGL